MNREKSRQRRQRNIRVATIFLLSCLLTGIALFPKNQSGQAEPNPTVVSGESKATLVDWTPRIDAPLQKESMATVQHMSLKVSEETTEKKSLPAPMIAVVPLASTAVVPTATPVTEAKKRSSEPETKQKVKNEVQVLSAESDGFVYNSEIPMPEKHQKYLYDLTKKRGLDYEKALAVIQHESVYDPNVISESDDYGYFQVNIVNHENLSNALNTPNKPLDPYVNLNWGTYMLSDLYDYWKEKGVSGSNLDEYVWSSYNKGLGGFKEHGKATNYIKKVREALTELSA